MLFGKKFALIAALCVAGAQATVTGISIGIVLGCLTPDFECGGGPYVFASYDNKPASVANEFTSDQNFRSGNYDQATLKNGDTVGINMLNGEPWWAGVNGQGIVYCQRANIANCRGTFYHQWYSCGDTSSFC